MKIEILDVKVETKPTAKGSYQRADVVYTNLTFNKPEKKTIMSFGATAGAFTPISKASKGDVFEVTVVKNDKGFNDWVSVEASTTDTPSPQGVYVPNNTTGKAQVSPRSTYETPEERAIKQVYIVRQSCINYAISLLGIGAKSAPALDTVLDVARQLEKFVFDKSETPATQAEQTIHNLESDIV